MRRSVPGSEVARRGAVRPRTVLSRHRTPAVPARGFTLIELLVVVALVAIASAVATLALRDPEVRLRSYAVIRRGRAGWPPLALMLRLLGEH